jgi:hypothetical protein
MASQQQATNAGKNTDSTPQGGAQGSSHLYNYNASPNTRAAISQKVRILTPVYKPGNAANSLLYQLGVCSSFTADFNRGVEDIRGIGFGDQIAERVPGVSDPVECSLERTLMYLSNGHQAFGFAGGVDGPVRTLQHHKWPFDIEQQLVFSTIADVETPAQQNNNQLGLREIDFSGQKVTGAEEAYGQNGQKHKAIITYFEACWMTAITGANPSADSSLMAQSISAAAQDVHDLFSTYGEFLPSGNDPTLGQVATLRYNGLNGKTTGRIQTTTDRTAIEGVNRGGGGQLSTRSIG